MVPAPRVTWRVHERHVDAVAEGRVGGDRIDLLGDRHALAGQRRFVDLEGRRSEDAGVGRDEVACLDVDDVARDELVHGHFAELAAAPDLGLDDHHLLEGRHARRGLALLVEAHRSVEERQQDQHDAGRELVRDEQAQNAGDEEDDLHRVAVLADERLPARLLLRIGELVGAELRTAGNRLPPSTGPSLRSTL